jgi:CBS domain containing-hemolysin-like protein
MIFWNVLLVFVLIGLNGFFVGVEIAAIASRRARLDLLADVESGAAQQVRAWLDNPAARDRLIAGSQLGITVVSLALGAIGESTFEALLTPLFATIKFPTWLEFLTKILPAVPLILALIVVTGLHVVLGEQVPKVAVLRTPERFALIAAPLMKVFSTIFKGFIDLLDWSTRSVLKAIGLSDAGQHSSVYSLEEIKQIVAGPEAEGVIEQPEREMLSAVFDFGELIVRQVALPRTEIEAIEAVTPLDEAIERVIRQPMTKLPVYEDNLDQIVGILHVRDLLAAMRDPAKQKVSVRTLAREALFVPETISVNDLLAEFRAHHTHIAIVMDEFGGTAGLVTLDDLLEEIVGKVRDPFDVTPPSIQTQADGSALIDGLTPIEEVNEYFGTEMSDPNYDTIAGYVLGRLGRMAQIGDTVENPKDKILLKVEAMDGLRIARISLRKVETGVKPAEAEE